MKALAATAYGLYEIDLETEEVEPREGDLVATPGPKVSLPRVVASAACGSTVVAVVDRRPPLAVSNDSGRTWRETGGGLPAGRAVAIAAEDPDVVLYAARNRLYLSRDGGRFWSALAPELPEIRSIALD